jgi:hypothetical protein
MSVTELVSTMPKMVVAPRRAVRVSEPDSAGQQTVERLEDLTAALVGRVDPRRCLLAGGQHLDVDAAAAVLPAVADLLRSRLHRHMHDRPGSGRLT